MQKRHRRRGPRDVSAARARSPTSFWGGLYAILRASGMLTHDLTEDEPASARRIVGSFALGRKLGEGGMGVVYEAEHLRSGHRVAVKLLHAEVAAKPALMRRLRVEAQAANRVPSRGAVQVLDCVEQEDGTAFLVMELLTGDCLRTLLGQWDAGLPLLPALALLARIARIMAAAHAVGVVHRDLKPANVFLNSAEDAGADPDPLHGEVKIIDFGLAKLLSAERPADSPPERSLTQDGLLIGTAKYLAPEQAMDPGASDGQVDVYALGVVAYEALSGRPPFEAESAWELVSMHLRDTPVALRTRRPEVPPPVAELVEQMLAKTPVLRPSMAQVYERLQALSGELRRDPVSGPRAEAVAPPAGPRVPGRLWRRAGAVFALCAVCAVLLGGLVLGLRRQRQAQRQKEVAIEVAQQLVRLIDQRFQDVPGAAAAAREMLDVTVTMLDRLRAQSSPDAQLDQSLVHARILRGQHLRNHGNLADAQADFQQAVVLGEALLRRQPAEVAYRTALASAYDSLADTQEQLASLKQAQVNYLRALALRQALVSERPGNPELHRDLALSHVHLGDLTDSLGQSAETRAHLEAARRDLEPLWKAEPDNPKYRTMLIGVYYRLAKLLPILGRTADGMAVALQASELQARQLALEPGRAGSKQLMARVLQELGAVRQRSGDLDGAIDALGEAAQLHRSLVQLDGKDPQYRRDLADSLRNAADLSLQCGAVDAAEQQNHEALQLDEELTREEPAHRGYRWRVATNYRRLGDIALARGQQAAARSAYQRAVELQESLVLADPHNAQQRRRLAHLLEKAGAQLLASGDLPMAQSRLAQALQIDEELLRSDPQRSEYREAVARAQQQLAAVQRRRGQLREAEQELTAALAAQTELARADRENALVRKEQLATLLELGALVSDAPRAAALRAQAEAVLGELADHHALTRDAQLPALRAAMQQVE